MTLRRYGFFVHNYLAEGSANAPYITSIILAYKVVSGQDLDSYQAHARFILPDTKTGYRSQYLARYPAL